MDYPTGTGPAPSGRTDGAWSQLIRAFVVRDYYTRMCTKLLFYFFIHPSSLAS